MTRKNIQGLIASIVTVAVAGIYFAFQWNPLRGGTQDVVYQPATPVVAGSAISTPVLANANRAPVGRKPAQEDAVRAFKDRFGGELRLEFHDDGRLSSIRGVAGAGGVPGYSSADPQKAIARAREVIEGARALLGLQAALPLDNPVVNATAISAQVRFNETLAGLRLAPIGDVMVDLGPQGEILALDSSYLPNVVPDNEVTITPDQARQSALSILPENERAGARIDAGSKVVWILSPEGDGSRPSSRYAYEYSVDGRQVVIDAGNGSLILRRDRRSF